MSKRARARSTLLAFVGLSAALHGAALVILPGSQRVPDLPRFTTLEVVLVQAAAMAPQVAAVERVTIAPPAPQLSEPGEVALTLPESAAVVPALPAPATERATSPDVGPRTDVASVALTPPSFSAAYLGNPPPHYPPAARQAGEQGTVTLRVLVSRTGLAARVIVEKSSGSPRLDGAALEAVRTWRFAPAQQGAQAVESWMLVPIVFRLESAS